MTEVDARRREHRRRGRLRQSLEGYAFLLPNFTGFAAFTFLPVVASFVLAFYSWDMMQEARFIGLRNFINLLTSSEFWYYFYNTVFLMAGIPVGMALSLGMAMLVNQKLKGIVVFRTVYFLPHICVGVALYVLWVWIYNPEFGLFNQLIQFFTGVKGPAWLSDRFWAKPALIIMGLWAGAGGKSMILYLAGLQGIDPSLYEVADIDGVGAWGKFRYITIPMLAPTSFFIFIMSVIEGFQGGFDQVIVMTGGGPPPGATTTISYYIFTEAFEEQRMGYAAAVSWFLFLLVFAVTLINWRFGGRRVHY